jgi:hypothetical protein
MLTRLPSRRPEEHRLVVPYDPGHSTVGGHPCVPVVAIHFGFDWDNGKVFIQPEKNLGIVGPDLEALRAQTHEVHETMAWIMMALRNKRLDPASKVRAIRSHLNEYRKRYNLPELTEG